MNDEDKKNISRYIIKLTFEYAAEYIISKLLNINKQNNTSKILQYSYYHPNQKIEIYFETNETYQDFKNLKNALTKYNQSQKIQKESIKNIIEIIDNKLLINKLTDPINNEDNEYIYTLLSAENLN